MRACKMECVKEIEREAFAGCHSLSDVDFGKVEIIGYAALCFTDLGSINLSSVRRVDVLAFQGCERLTEAIFSAKLERIEQGAFCECTALRRIAIPWKNNMVDWHDENDPFD